MKKPKIVVLGAGYGGLMTVTRLQKALSQNEAEIVLVNQNDYHYETTWLHEASAGTVHYDRVRYPIASVINKHKVNFIQDTVIKINTTEKSDFLFSVVLILITVSWIKLTLCLLITLAIG